MRLDAVIFGGDAAGLWLLDRLSRDGHHVVLLEARGLGAGQTVGSQAILHVGRTTAGNRATQRNLKPLRELPNLWRNALLGRVAPNLTRTRLRSECCHLWQVDSGGLQISSGEGEFGRVADGSDLSADERPAVLSEIGGPVRQLPEPVICPASFLADLADQYRDRLLQIDAERGLRFRLNSPGEVDSIELTSPSDGQTLELKPRQVIFTAGSDNARLRALVGLSIEAVSSRSLHVVLARGNLPELNGYCLAGGRNLLTITSDIDDEARTVWQIGGPLAETGHQRDPQTQSEHVRTELTRVLPQLDLRSIEWSTYRLDRSEGESGGDARREGVQVYCAGNVTTGCPTRLVLAPVLAAEIADRASSPYISTPFDPRPLAQWPRPDTATLPWNEVDRDWWTLSDLPAHRQPNRRAA